MTIFNANVSRTAILQGLYDALTATGSDWDKNVDKITGSDYFVVDIDDASGEDSLYAEMPTDSSLKLRYGLNWEDGQQAFVHPNPTPDNCEDATFPGEIWSDTTDINAAIGTITRGTEWLAWSGRAQDEEIRIATARLNRSSDYQSFAETVTCQCDAKDDPNDDCDGPDDTYTKNVTGYNAYAYAATLRRGGSFSETWGTISGSLSGDIDSTPYSARTGDNDYERDDQYDLLGPSNNVVGNHEQWIQSDDDPINLSDRGELTASGTYTTPAPHYDGAIYKV